MSTVVFRRDNEYLAGFDVAGVPQVVEDLNDALWVGTEDDEFDGYDTPAREAGFVAEEVV